jgi:predicted RNase H-like HicB family nuclease
MITADGLAMLPVRRIIGRRRYRRLQAMNIETEREDDGRWIAEVPDLPGVMVYGRSREEAISRVKALALRVLADRLEHGESIPELGEVFAVPA